MLRRRIALGLLLVVVAALLVFRFEVVQAWHQPAGDGVQYYNLAEQLREHGRFAFAPPPRPLSYARLPGYPLMMWLLSLGQPLGLGDHIWRAVQGNLVFDLLSALFLVLAAREAGLRRGWLAALVVLTLPTLLLMTCYALTESFSMMLAAAELYFALALVKRGHVGFAVGLGVAAGLAQLTRLDALCAAPMLVYACWRIPPPRRRKLTLVAAGCALAVFSPWPIRNLVDFGAPHFGATTWRAVDGTPLGTGPVQWARTWSDSSEGAYFELYFVYQKPYEIDRFGAVPHNSFDDAAERERLVGILRDYNREGLSPHVNDEFVTLAKDRLRAHPLRTLVVLPARRIEKLFSDEPEYEMPMRISWLKLPERRPWFIRFDRLLFALAALGAILSWRRRRDLLWLTLPPILLRVALYSVAIPQAVAERYLVEAFPLFILLFVAAVTAVEERLVAR